MEGLNTVPLVHYFDPEKHRILCGLPGFDRSTKHSRGVTCPSCVELLRADHDRSTARRLGAAEAAAHPLE